MFTSQKNKFKLPDNVTYLNCAYMSPFLKTVEEAGHKSVSQKCLPFQVTGEDFFTATNQLKKLFAELVDIKDYQNVAIIPSVSYGVATVANNITLDENDEIIVVGEQFPSNIYSWQRLVDKFNAKLTIISSNIEFDNRGENWNIKILNAITSKTKIVALPHVHWSDGTLFDLMAIREKTKKNNAYLIIDATQSVGALPFSVKEIKPDALICAGYKWLLGPYSIGLAYYSDELCNGIPIEENWINRKNSEDFKGLVNYENDYQPKAGRFNVGEMSNFALTPMLIKSIEQLLAWNPKNIQQYCHEISKDAIKQLQDLGCYIEDEKYRGAHLFGIYLPKTVNLAKLKEEFIKNNIYVSYRGNAIRVSPNVYNTKDDFDKLIACFKNI